MINIYDLQALYKTTFGNKYFVKPKSEETPIERPDHYTVALENPRRRGSVDYSQNQIALNKIGSYGQAIWFPVEFWKSNKIALTIDACTISVQLSSTIIRTTVSERRGTIKEQFSEDDYKFTIKGFLIGKDRFFPEDQILLLKEIKETREPISLHGGYPELFLDESCRVVITSLDFPEVTGKATWIRPFNLTCESDFILDLKAP